MLKEGRESTKGTPFPRFWFLSPLDRVCGEATRAGEPLKASKLGTNPVTRLPRGRAFGPLGAAGAPKEKRGNVRDDARRGCSSWTRPVSGARGTTREADPAVRNGRRGDVSNENTTGVRGSAPESATIRVESTPAAVSARGALLFRGAEARAVRLDTQ